jgi:hypothetical protein
MKKKELYFCMFTVLVLLVLPVGSALNASLEDQNVTSCNDTPEIKVSLDPFLFTGYILIHVYTYSPGVGIAPCVGANVTARGFLYSYQGQTDDSGDCLLQVHTNLFRAKRYVVKVSVEPGDWLHTRRITVLLQPRQILYKEFLFIAL